MKSLLRIVVFLPLARVFVVSAHNDVVKLLKVPSLESNCLMNPVLIEDLTNEVRKELRELALRRMAEHF
jgi:hypothetical protein